MARRWVNAPPSSHWGEFGDDDQRGRMNLVTAGKVLQGICLIADKPAVELVVPKPQRRAGEHLPRLPLHEHCLFKNGIHLGELWYLTALAQHLRGEGRHRFLLTAPPLRLPGAVGSPATPIATV